MRLERDTLQELVAELHAQGMRTRAIAPIVRVRGDIMVKDIRGGGNPPPAPGPEPESYWSPEESFVGTHSLGAIYAPPVIVDCQHRLVALGTVRRNEVVHAMSLLRIGDRVLEERPDVQKTTGFGSSGCGVIRLQSAFSCGACAKMSVCPGLSAASRRPWRGNPNGKTGPMQTGRQ